MTDRTPVPNRPDPAKANASNKKDYDGKDVVDDHIALKNQSSVKSSDYPASDRAAQSLVTPRKKDKSDKSSN